MPLPSRLNPTVAPLLALLAIAAGACASSLDDVPGGDAADAGGDAASDAPSDPAQDGTDVGEPEGDVGGEAGDDVSDVNIDAPPDQPPTTALLELSDWADCLEPEECPGHDFASSGVTITIDPTDGAIHWEGGRYTGLEGRIEAVGTHPLGYDADLIGIRAPARTVLTVLVEPADAESAIDPFVTTVDYGEPGGDFRFQEITSNDESAPGEVAARTMVASPFDEAPFYVWVDDARNVTGGAAIGGEAFRYVLRFEVASFAPAEIDVSGGSGGVSGVDLAFAGDVHFYRFSPDEPGDWRVELTTANTDFLGYLIGFDTRGGRLQPIAYDGSEGWAPTRQLGPSAFRVDARNEYVFAVTDWLGRGSNTSDSLFFYEVSVAAD